MPDQVTIADTMLAVLGLALVIAAIFSVIPPFWKTSDKEKGPILCTEECPTCREEVTIEWDVKKDGYTAFCPKCGNRLMMCSECFMEINHCDFDSSTDTCSQMFGNGKERLQVKFSLSDDVDKEDTETAGCDSDCKSEKEKK